MCRSWWVSGSKKFRLLFHFSYCLASYLASLKPKTRQRCKPSAAYGHPAATCVPAVGFAKRCLCFLLASHKLKGKKAQKPVSLVPFAHPAVFVPVVLLALSEVQLRELLKTLPTRSASATFLWGSQCLRKAELLEKQ